MDPQPHRPPGPGGQLLGASAPAPAAPARRSTTTAARSTAAASPDCAVGCDCDRYMEFWNLVFSQFDSDGNGNYTPMAHPNIDTGMGLERLACIMQGVDNLFEVDTVQNIMKHICRDRGDQVQAGSKSGCLPAGDHRPHPLHHLYDRATASCPSNEGRGYVLRRLLRRAARHGRLLGIKEPFLYKVCETVIRENASAYPELVEHKDYIVKIIKAEEERFATHHRPGHGAAQQPDRQDRLPRWTRSCSPGPTPSSLYDTFGFPIDLIREILEERDIQLDEEEFKAQMEAQKERAREARAALGDLGWEEDVLAGVEETAAPFVGYTEPDRPGQSGWPW